MVERNNQIVGTAISFYLENHYLASIQFAINNAKRESIGYTPAFLVFGRHLPISDNLYSNNLPNKDLKVIHGSREFYALNLKHLAKICKSVRRNLHNACEHYSKYYNLWKRE